MKRLLAALLLVASPVLGQATNGWAEMANGWGEIQTPPGYSTIPAPTGCTSGLVPYFNASLQLVCSPTVYAPATDTTTATGTVVARNLTVTALATPTVTSVTPTLTQVGTINVVAGASLADGDYFTVDYGSGTIPIEFDLTPGNGTTGGRVPYVYAAGDAAGTIRDGLIALINAAAPTQVLASIGGAAAITITRIPAGTAGGTITENVANAGFTVAGFANPTAATTYGYKAVSYLADGTSTAASTEVTTAAGHATLSASNYNTVVFAPSPGSVSTRLYRTTGGAAPPKLLYTGTATTFTDTGAAGTAQTPSTVNTTGVVTAAKVYLGGYTPDATALGVTGTIASSSGFFANVYNNLAGTSPITTTTAATLQLGAAASASPVSQVLQAQGSRGGTDTDVAGANLTIRPGAGTGAAAGSSVVFATPSATTTGSTQQTLSTRVTIGEGGLVVYSSVQRPAVDDTTISGTSAFQYKTSYLSRATLGSKSKAITDGSATAFATFTIADGATYTGEVIYKIKAIQGTSLQALAGRARFAATREGSTYTVVVNEVGTQLLAAAAGTLTGAIEIGGTGGVVTLSANFNTSLTPTTFTIDARFDSPDAALALTFP